MSKKAILDSKLISPLLEAVERTNLLISHSKLIGIGYIPDDEECDKLQANGYYTINAVTSVKKPNTPHSETDFLNAGVTHWILPTNDCPNSPFCVLENADAIDDSIQHAENTQTPCLVALQSSKSPLLNTEYTHTQFSLPSSDVIHNTKSALRQLIDKKATHIHIDVPSDSTLFEIHEALKSTFSLKDIVGLTSYNAWQFLPTKPDPVALLKSPSFTLLSTSKTPRILATFVSSTLVEEN
jgi:hypothetical protein